MEQLGYQPVTGQLLQRQEMKKVLIPGDPERELENYSIGGRHSIYGSMWKDLTDLGERFWGEVLWMLDEECRVPDLHLNSIKLREIRGFWRIEIDRLKIRDRMN